MSTLYANYFAAHSGFIIDLLTALSDILITPDEHPATEPAMSRNNLATAQQIEIHLNGTQSRRMKAEDRFLDVIAKREVAADAMIGELNSGKLYVYPVGGRYREGTRRELINFLIRNNYA